MTDVHQFEEIPPYAMYALKSGNPVCLHCLMHLEPSSEHIRCHTSKEVLILAEVDRRLPILSTLAIEFRCDQALGACSKKRPDMVWDFGVLVLWLEINEHQHATYDSRCEVDRRYQIWRDLDCRPTLLVEFNPDEYTDTDGYQHRSMFRTKRTGSGEKRLSPVQGEFAQRIERLVDVLTKALEAVRIGRLWDGVHQEFMFYTPSVRSQFEMTSWVGCRV